MTEYREPIKTHADCPYCGGHGCFTLWEDGGFFCHQCDAAGGGKSKKDTMSQEIVKKYKEVIKSYRKIHKKAADFYGITTSEDDKGVEVRRVYPYPHKDKYRYLPKDFTKNSGFTTDHLFGMDKFNAGSSKYITIVEGEDDVPSAYQMLGYKLPVVGLPGAGISHKLLQNCHDYLDSFDCIVVATDGDKAGEKAADKLANAFPNKVYRVSMTKHKDPNAFLEAGDEEDFVWAWRNKKKYVPDGIYNTPSQFKDIVREKAIGAYYPTPYEELNDLIKGLIKGHLYVLTGEEGQGKTEVLRSFEYHLLKNTDCKIASLHMEESKRTNLMSLVCYELGKNVRDPDHTVTQSEIDKAIEELTKDERLYLFDFNVDDDPLHILDKVRYFKEACDVDFVFIDPIQQLAYGHERDSSEEKTLTQIAVQLEKLATQLDIGIVMTTHVNDDGKIRSSRMIGKSASVRIDLKREHMNPDPVIKNTTTMSVSKNRPMSQTGYAGQLVFDPDTFTLEESVKS